MRPCRFCGAAIENQLKSCPRCGRDDVWPPKEQPKPPVARFSRNTEDPPEHGLDFILMEPALLYSLVVFALIGFSVYAVAASSSNRQSEFAKRVQSRELLPISMRIMEVCEEPNSVTVAVGNGQTVKFRRDLPLSIHVPLGARVDVYEDGEDYFVPVWETDASPSFATIVLFVTLTPFLLLLAVIIFRFRTVYLQTTAHVRE